MLGTFRDAVCLGDFAHANASLKTLLFLEGEKRTVVINTPWYLRED